MNNQQINNIAHSILNISQTAVALDQQNNNVRQSLEEQQKKNEEMKANIKKISNIFNRYIDKPSKKEEK